MSHRSGVLAAVEEQFTGRLSGEGVIWSDGGDCRDSSKMSICSVCKRG